MPNFPDLPPELRERVYQFCLTSKEPIDPWEYPHRAGSGHGLATNLLRASKAVYREASAVLYSHNLLDFDERPSDAVASFLDRIGPANADQLRHVVVAFPKLHGRFDYVHLDQQLVCVLSVIGSRCPRVRSVTASKWQSRGLLDLWRLPPGRYYEITANTLAWADARFRSLPSLREILVEAYDYGDDADDKYPIRREMKRLGWTISAPSRSDRLISNGVSPDEENIDGLFWE